MGERGNIVVRDRGNDVCLYTHWSGYRLDRFVYDTLKRERRWNDGPYLTRMLFGHMLDGDEPTSETGFGISSKRLGAEYPEIILNVDDQMVYIQSRLDQSLLASMTFRNVVDDFDSFRAIFRKHCPEYMEWNGVN